MVCNQSPPVDAQPSLMTFRCVGGVLGRGGHAGGIGLSVCVLSVCGGGGGGGGGHMVCNQSPPVDGQPSLMTFRCADAVSANQGYAEGCQGQQGVGRKPGCVSGLVCERFVRVSVGGGGAVLGGHMVCTYMELRHVGPPSVARVQDLLPMHKLTSRLFCCCCCLSPPPQGG
jgi:hypothetical protein